MTISIALIGVAHMAISLLAFHALQKIEKKSLSFFIFNSMAVVANLFASAVSVTLDALTFITAFMGGAAITFSTMTVVRTITGKDPRVFGFIYILLMVAQRLLSL
jgi:hypothetical protein